VQDLCHHEFRDSHQIMHEKSRESAILKCHDNQRKTYTQTMLFWSFSSFLLSWLLWSSFSWLLVQQHSVEARNLILYIAQQQNNIIITIIQYCNQEKLCFWWIYR